MSGLGISGSLRATVSSRKRFEVDIPDGTHLDHSRASDGAYRGTLRDDNNNLVGHAELIEVQESEWDTTEDEWERSEDDDGTGLGGLLAIVGVVGAAIGTAVVVSRVKEARSRNNAEQQLQAEASAADEHAVSANRRMPPPADWYEDRSGCMRWWDGQQWTEHVRRPESNAPSRHPETAHGGHADQSCEVSPARGQAQATMSSAEWQERVRAMLLARAFSEEQWRLLSNARIEDADAALLESQRELRSLTPQQFSDRISALLEKNPNMLWPAALPAPPSWYDDGSGNYRWWDGNRWTGYVQPVAVKVLANPAAPAPPGWHDDGSGRQRWWTGQHWV